MAKIIEQWISENYYHNSLSVVSIYDNEQAIQRIYSKTDWALEVRFELTDGRHTLNHVYNALYANMEGGLKSRLLGKETPIWEKTYSKINPIPRQKIWKKPIKEDLFHD